MKSNPRQGNMGNNRTPGAGNNRPGNMGNQRQGNMGNQRQGNMGNQNRMGAGTVGRGPATSNPQRNMRGPMNNAGSGGQMNQMSRFSGNKFGGKTSYNELVNHKFSLFKTLLRGCIRLIYSSCLKIF